MIAQEDGFVSINSTVSVDLMGQCASETVNGAYYSSSGGQADFARGAMYSKGGQGFVVLHSTAKDGTISKIVAQLAPGDVVTTLKNTVDKVVTEWGVAELPRPLDPGTSDRSDRHRPPGPPGPPALRRQALGHL